MCETFETSPETIKLRTVISITHTLNVSTINTRAGWHTTRPEDESTQRSASFLWYVYIVRCTDTNNVHWTIAVSYYHPHIMDILLLLMSDRNRKPGITCLALCYHHPDKISQMPTKKVTKKKYLCQIIYLFIGK